MKVSTPRVDSAAALSRGCYCFEVVARSSPLPAIARSLQPKAARHETSIKLGCASGPIAVRPIESHTWAIVAAATLSARAASALRAS